MAAPSLEPPRDLTLPEPGSTTARGVLSRATGRLLSELGNIPRIAAHEGVARDELDAFKARTAALWKTSPGALLSAVRRPTVGALLRPLRRAPSDDALLAELIALVYFELALQGSLREPARITRVPRRLICLPARLVVEVPDDTRAITFAARSVTLHRASGDAAIDLDAESSLLLPIAGDVLLALADNNPYAMQEAHPDKGGNTVDLGGHAAEEWVSTLSASLALIGEFLPELRGELDVFIHQFVPVGWHAEQHLSASYREAIGTIYLTLHPSLMTMTEAVIHEFSHNKLNALFEIDDVLENAFWPLYTSPVRPDPRPLHGVLLAVHAFLPVARLYEKMIAAAHPLSLSPSFTARYARVREINAEGAAVVLEHARPTAVGAGVLDELRRWDAHYRLVP